MATAINREAWLTKAVPHLAKLIDEAETGLVVPAEVGVSCGWPGGKSFHKVVGQCWTSKAGKGRVQVFISPLVNDPHTVLAILLHELIHAADDCQHQHKGIFRATWAALGFVGKPTQSTPDDELAVTLAAIADKLGDYPHTGMDPGAQSTIPKQTTRMLKVECDDCGCIVRMTAKWLEEVGPPRCGCGGRMHEAV